MKSLFNLFIIIAVGFGIYGVVKTLPEGVNVAGAEYTAPNGSVAFLEDRTYVDGNGVRHSDQEIFDEAFRMIRGAHRYVLVDMFLYNDLLGTATTSYRALSEELTDTLIAKKKSEPSVDIIVITDPINEIYGGIRSDQFSRLKDAGVELVVTDLLPLRDSNPVFSGFYRAYIRWFKSSPKEGYLPNPFDTRLPGLSLRPFLSILNFKANHRKVVLADNGNTFDTLITSANPHDGSSAHTNTAIKVHGGNIWKDVLASELAVADFSGAEVPRPAESFLSNINDPSGSVTIELLTEKKIRDKLLEEIDKTKKDDAIDMAMFYLSDREIIDALKRAASRNVSIRILLDPNKDAFGRKKNGIPNRPVATELEKTRYAYDLDVRFCDTHGEQCHTKFVLFKTKEGMTLIDGSANLTRRNIGGYNLETDILVKGASPQAALDAERYFEKVWNNEGGKIYSTDYETYKDESLLHMFLYRFMEDLGTSSF